MPLLLRLHQPTVHPHVCGACPARVGLEYRCHGSSPRVWGVQKPPRNIISVVGSSPRVWGVHFRLDLDALRLRFIPTCVGRADFRDLCSWARSVHPHVCGACLPSSLSERGDTVHPHVCGACSKRFAQSCGPAGSSPRVWGVHHLAQVVAPAIRFIPTCVGRANQTAHYQTLPSVHPHVCGACGMISCLGTLLSGSSPRVWGVRTRG